MSSRSTISSSIQRCVRALHSVPPSQSRVSHSLLSIVDRRASITMAVNGMNGTNGVRHKHDLSALKVNGNRLQDAIHSGCKFGEAWRYGE